jgi:hypothetical protein
MKRIMKIATFAFLVTSSPALAEEGNGTGPVRLNAPRLETPPPVIKPKLIRPPSVVGNGGAGQDAPQPQSRTNQSPLPGVKQQPNTALQQVRPRVAPRELSRRIDVAGGVLALPKVEYYGVPVILDVPGLGFVDVPEDEYPQLYEKLLSSDSEQVQEAISALRRFKEAEEALVEALQHAPRMEPDDIQDLSEPIFFHSPSGVQRRRKGLY